MTQLYSATLFRVGARRAPSADARQRDAERSRRLILEAALAEFAERGFAGARTSAIARRAGVNAQLISYYFDGKAGLYQELTRQGRQGSDRLADPDVPLAEVVAAFLRQNVAQHEWARLLVWEALSPAGDDAEAGAPAFFQDMIEGMRLRQERGELAPELDPAAVLVVLFAAAFAPVVLPQLTTAVTGHAPDSVEAVDELAARLRPVIARLR